ncbi:hypothetical protein BGW38_005391 [Lunasporangiospora selenospora]|uniref:C2H2-type domain-containing protein n=1 Tax=Lunasporangiospora selenospora TaxID=979761 RepID=A0A9P6KAW9_9FUNG|nr:hypothetical protein BGW38_005391 [Lunasporangiospora selenospora]
MLLSHTIFDTYSSSPRRGDVYDRDLEANYCKNFSCCGLTLLDMHALLQHYEEAHVCFEDEDDYDDLPGIAGFTDEDGWSTNSESEPSSPQLAHNSIAAAAATAAALAAATTAQPKLTPASFLNAKRKQTGVSLSDIYSEDFAFIPDESVSAFQNSVLRATAQAKACSASKKRDLAAFSTSFDTQSPLAKKAATAAASVNASPIKMPSTAGQSCGTPAPAPTPSLADLLLSAKAESADPASSKTTAQDQLYSAVTGYLEHAIQQGMLPSCGEAGSSGFLLTAEDLLLKRDEIVSMMESIGRADSSGADKPYRCTVNGCDKAYKNPNGLKYHNLRGHCNMVGSSDDEKNNSRPYRCTFLDCGKCYKNLNGLKYHIEHSHPNLAAALHASVPGFIALEGGNASQATIAAAAAIAAVQANPMMMAAASAIMASAHNSGNNARNSQTSSTPAAGVSVTRSNTPEATPQASPMLGPLNMDLANARTFTGAALTGSLATPLASPVLEQATIPSTIASLSIQTKSCGEFMASGMMTPSSPTSPIAPRSPSHVSNLTAALAAVSVEQQRLQ